MATRYNASVTDCDGGTVAVVVTDISRDGCRLETDGSLRIGEMVEIQTARYGSFPAQIRWALGNEAGAVFLKPTDLPEDDNRLDPSP